MIATMTLLVTALWMPAQEPAAETPTRASASAMSAEEHIEMGKAAFKKKRFAAARDHFQQAVEANPDSAAAHFYLGYAIYKIAEPKRPNSPGKQEAAGHFAKAYELDPGFKPTWRGRG
jgi:tetratricopeptide (TPR) repeat protein